MRLNEEAKHMNEAAMASRKIMIELPFVSFLSRLFKFALTPLVWPDPLVIGLEADGIR